MEIVTRVAADAIISSVVQRMTGVINDDNRNILQIDLQRMQIILQDIDLFRDQQKAPPETLKIWLQLLQNALAEAKRLLDSSAPRQRCLDCVMRHPRRFSNEVREWNAFFDNLYHGFETDVSILVTSLHVVSSKPLYKKDALYRGIPPSSFVVSDITDAQPLSGDEASMLFRRVAFKEDQVSMNIEERAEKIEDGCRGLPLAINVVAAAMIGQTSEQDWDNCLSSMINVDPSFPATHPRLHVELYAQLGYGYEALPNSDVKRCFLYCAMYKEDQEIEMPTLLQMWIGEGLVKSKQGTYLMDMAIRNNISDMAI